MLLRLNKFISENSKYSRRKADELIKEGEVLLNKNPAKLGEKVDPQKDKVTILGENVSQKKQKIYIALYKPAGYITTRSDELDRKTVMDLVPKIENLKPIGRLDKDSEGLLLISNDGEFINRMTHPKFECEKEYKAEIKGSFTKEKQKRLEEGIRIDRKKTYPAKITILNKEEDNTILTIKIHEGRNRQIRKMFAQINCPVKYLTRLSIGKIKLSNLEKGSYRNLTTTEINAN